MDVELSEKQKMLFEASEFVLKLLLAGVAFRLILLVNIDTSTFEEYLAFLIYNGLELIGFEFMLSGNKIIADKAVYVIIQDCLGWKSLALFTGLAFASKKRISSNIREYLSLVGVLLAANYLRVFSTILLAEGGILSFDLVHNFLWQWSLAAVVLITWIFWIKQDSISVLIAEQWKSSMDYIKGGLHKIRYRGR